MSARISIFGLGYVGSVTAGCLAHHGHHVTGVDLNHAKVESFNAGRAPVLEPRLDELLATARTAGRIVATADTAEAVATTSISFICVGTPSMANGRLDVSIVESVCRDIGVALAAKEEPHLVVLRSTVLPGTAEQIALPALEAASGRRAGDGFDVCSNPEFLREGSAVADFLEPPMTVLGGRTDDASARLRALYEWTPGHVFETSLAAAEMIKYACNSFHAVKIAFANEMGTLCKQLGVDAEAVTRMFTADERLNISPAYLKPGFAFGGSCLPKDLRALTYRARELDVDLPLLESVIASNDRHLERAADMVLGLRRRDVALLGLSFKPGTDDLRESPQVQLVKRLIGEGCNVRIWDPNVTLGRLIGSNRAFIEDYIPHIGSLLHDSLARVIEGAGVVVLATTAIDRDELMAALGTGQAMVDLVNLAREARPPVADYHGMCW